jgi:ribosomal protein S18 acetylase RimI-like enzyme
VTRSRVQLRRSTTPIDVLPGCPGLRALVPSDAEPVGRLLYDAFHGGVDDEGETVDDAVAVVRELFAAPTVDDLRLDASFVIERSGRLIAAVVTANLTDEPFIAYLMTEPAERRRGLGRCLVLAVLTALAKAGDQSVTLWVTDTNSPALALYEQLDFVNVATMEV